MSATGRDGARRCIVAAALAALTFTVFLPVRRLGFVWDDYHYLHLNPLFASGPSPGAAGRAFTTFHSANWHPVTWLSHLLDLALFGYRPAGHHLVNLFLHAANAALLFALLARLTGGTWRPAAVAAIFAVHPLRVESVAWIAERKDLLAALFSLGALLAWVRHLREPRLSRLAAALLLLALALGSKPMAVSVPLLMLVLDWWPLGRAPRRSAWAPLFREKLPFAALAAGSAAITLAAQSAGGAVDAYPLAGRLANAARSLVVYLRDVAWPADLAAFYPLRDVPLSVALGSAAVIAAITALALRLAPRRPWLIAGWAWYLAAILPVLGLVQVGAQAMADRYTYLPIVGVLIALLWTAATEARRRNLPALAPAALTGAAVIALSVATRALIPFWNDGVALWSRAERISPGSQRIHLNLGNALREQGNLTGAERYLRAALGESPRDPLALAALGALLADTGRGAEALPLLEQALRSPQTESVAAMWLGRLREREGDLDAGIAYYRRALAVDPALVPARNNLGVLLARRGEYAESAAHFRQLLMAQPGDAAALHNLARALELSGDPAGALERADAALRADPGNAETRAMRDRLRTQIDGGGNTQAGGNGRP